MSVLKIKDDVLYHAVFMKADLALMNKIDAEDILTYTCACMCKCVCVHVCMRERRSRT